ncbi:Tab2/Atab2 family RNA-binding protein [Calothrix sp. 336/3]|uniref:Tab2/Atab2 family RNA-binding protein n=1 Tax=Calothrix sp. 336/3 TaxID=1337936 RepID=UPI0004E41658|nr:Tab2/Atab2 family RNA-binding protein [Calothrix sp. 336/3]AKG23781.1 hypothetical protein IJ00_23010 [Calothrix sp. 336/3]
MRVWQADFYHHPQETSVWKLHICDATMTWQYTASCSQSEANSQWLTAQFSQAGELPEIIQVFRPQALSLIEKAAENLGISVVATRHTPALKKWLESLNFPVKIEKIPPIPVPEILWGESWRFGSLPAGDVTELLEQRPIPIVQAPEHLLPLNLGLASGQTIPGVVIYGGKMSMRLARWLAENHPVAVDYIPGAPDGLILEADLADRWVLVTFDDQDMQAAAQIYSQRQQQAKGLHFLLVQPDDSEITYSGFWLLQKE